MAGADDEPMDDLSKPVHAKSLEYSRKPKPKTEPKSKSTVKTRRGYGRKNGNKNKNSRQNKYFSLIGTNAAGLNLKRESFYSLLNILAPTIITVQETKLSKPGLVKIPGYQVFERIRKNKKGGGLLTAADEDVNPVLISTGKEEENEIMTIQIDVGEHKIRVINAYGPQEDDSTEIILSFWQEIEAEVMNAKDDDCSIIIELDANAKLGKDIIKDDPNQMSKNGRIMLDIAERQNLHIANASDVCAGTITRERVAENHVEKSVIDYIVVCEKMMQFLTEMTIDEQRIHVLRHNVKRKNTIKVITSDHNILSGKFSIGFDRKPKQIRREFFNFKCEQSRKTFLEETSSNNKISSCFSDPQSFEKSTTNFFKVLNRTFHKCFKKIRIRTGSRRMVGNKVIQSKLKEQTKLKDFIAKSQCKLSEEIAKSNLEKIEKDLADETATQNAEKIKEHLQTVESLDGNFSQIGFWKLKQKIWPSSCDPPMAKHDNEGNIITAPQTLKNLYLETYIERLKHREMKPELMDVFFLKSELWLSRLQNLKQKTTPEWNMDELDKVLSKLKNNKTMDPNGMVNEIFKAGCIGPDLKKALNLLFNGIKANQFLPMFMNLSNITSIYKNKGSRFDLNNDRGIFILTVLKKILDGLIYFDKYEDLDQNMSDSNIGGRRKRNVKDHLLIIYGIINEVIKGGEDCVDIQIYDLEKDFDALWLNDCLNDVFDTLPEHERDDKVSLLYESNKVNMVAVKTAGGLTDSVNIPIVQQGGTWGSMLCSNSIDTLGKKCKSRGEHIYLYKKTAEVLPLAFVDDLNGISKCGEESMALNTFITTQIELKKLKFHVPDKHGKSKCHKMHIGKRNTFCPTLKVHGSIMQEVTEDVYLGDIISCDGKNTKNVKQRISKGIGIVNQIFNLLGNVRFGAHQFEIAMLLRESMLINGTLTNSEIWYNFTKSEVEEFGYLDKLLFRRLLEVPHTTPGEAYYLELGVLPVSVIIKARRINYLHTILSSENTGMLYSFFITQWNNPTQGDWTEQVKKDLMDFQIPCSFDEIKKKSKEAFKRQVKIRATEYSLKSLKSKQATHSKMENLSYKDLKIQDYFLSDHLDYKQKQTIFKLRTRMERFGENFRAGNSPVICPLCKLHFDSQELSLQCPEIRKELEIKAGNYEEIYKDNIESSNIVKTLVEITKIRKMENK